MEKNMDADSIDQIGTLTGVLQGQAEYILAIILRPVLLYQIFAMLLILGITWLLPEVIRHWWGRHERANEDMGTDIVMHSQRWQAAYNILTPVLALVLLYSAMWLFEQQHIPNGLLQDLSALVWLWLTYRILITVLYSLFGKPFRPYQNWLVTPIFVFLVLWRTIAALPGFITIIEASINLGDLSFSLGNLVAALIVLYLFGIASWVINNAVKRSLSRQLEAEPGVISSIATLTRYALLATGIVVSLRILGLDFTSLAIIAGGLSVGIGLGMQDFVANFTSGLILLSEQTLRPGDVIELEGFIATVEKIGLRTTSVRTRTNEELIIPNSDFTSEKIKNLTRSDRQVRVLIPLGVSYESDPEIVKQIAVDTALQHPMVLAEPTPGLGFRGFGDSSLDFNLSVSINQPELSGAVRSDLYYMLWKAFLKHEIELPFPQRDLNLGNGWEKLSSGFQTPT
jgi:small-conductance mechanosensitive channel